MMSFERYCELMPYQVRVLVDSYNNGRYPVDGYVIPLGNGWFMGNDRGNYYLCQRETQKSEDEYKKLFAVA